MILLYYDLFLITFIFCFMLHNMCVLAVGNHFFIISKMSCLKSRNFISTYIINRTLHGRLGIQILSSCAKSISHLYASLTREIHSALEDKIRFPAQPCNILYFCCGLQGLRSSENAMV